MKTAKQWFLFLTLASSLIASASVYAADSTGLSNTLPAASGGSGIKAYYPDQGTAPYTGTGTSDITFNAGAGSTTTYFQRLPSCPLDANSTTQRKVQPVCPDINGKWVTVPPTLAKVKPGDKASAADLQTYCPDVCQTTRSVTTNSYTASGQTIQQITAYVPVVCPSGYVQVAATNPQPTVMDASQAGTTTLTTDEVTSKTQLDAYINQGMQCYGVYSSPTDMYVSAYCSDNVKNHPNVCTTNTSYSNITKTSVGLGNYTSAADGSTYYGVTITCGTSGKNYYADSKCTNEVLGSASGLLDSMYTTRYANGFIKIKCKPTGLYLSTTSQEPATLICARVKSVWQQRSN